MARRAPLSRADVLLGAVAVADRGGIAALTMRALADEVGVKPMSLYHHVAGKEDVLDGIVDVVFAEIDLPTPGDPWRPALRDRTTSARQALRRHPWATPLMDSRRNPGPATLRHHDAVVGVLREAGFPAAMVAHALSLVDSYLYGFAIQEEAMPVGSPEETASAAEEMSRHLDAAAHPHLAALFAEHLQREDYDYGAEEFEWGLDVVLEGIEREVSRAG